MGDLGDHLKRRAAELGLDRANQLAEIQKYLDERFGGQCRAASLNDGVLKITTQNASLASELRLRQIKLVERLQGYDIVKILIRIQ